MSFWGLAYFQRCLLVVSFREATGHQLFLSEQEGIQRQLEARKGHDVWAQRGFSDSDIFFRSQYDGSDHDDGFQWDFGLII